MLETDVTDCCLGVPTGMSFSRRLVCLTTLSVIKAVLCEMIG
jgi:hypothetical protein